MLRRLKGVALKNGDKISPEASKETRDDNFMTI